jgi:hypothetical protein
MGQRSIGQETVVEDRRSQVRRTLDVAARVAASPEQRLPRARCVDISRGGMLIAFDEPIVFPDGHRLVVSLDLPDGHFHALGVAVRTDRGDDFRTYVAMSFMSLRPEDYDELEAQLDRPQQPPSEAGASSSDVAVDCFAVS